jgi:CheY-like chemotaxis protein
MSRLDILLVEDDADNLTLLTQLLPTTSNGAELTWHPCSSFDEAYDTLKRRRFDMVVTDVYRDRKGEDKHRLNIDDAKGTNMLELLRAVRFCPIVFFSDGSQPENITVGPFVRFVDKVKAELLITQIEEIINTGIPMLAATLHDELDRAAGSYLWTFLEEQWNKLGPTHTSPPVLERLIRRRAAVQLAHLNPQALQPTELAVVQGAEFYLYPSIAGEEYRLGDVIEHAGTFRVILTPHCYLTTQPGKTSPRAEHILTVKTIPATELIGRHPFKGDKDEKLRRCINSPADIGEPKGRYWFLPEFLDIPNLFCDFLQLDSLPLDYVKKHRRIATLASPFAEALQACYLKFYTAVGLPTLQPDAFAAFKTITAANTPAQATTPPAPSSGNGTAAVSPAPDGPAPATATASAAANAGEGSGPAPAQEPPSTPARPEPAADPLPPETPAQ